MFRTGFFSLSVCFDPVANFLLDYWACKPSSSLPVFLDPLVFFVFLLVCPPLFFFSEVWHCLGRRADRESSLRLKVSRRASGGNGALDLPAYLWFCSCIITIILWQHSHCLTNESFCLVVFSELWWIVDRCSLHDLDIAEVWLIADQFLCRFPLCVYRKGEKKKVCRNVQLKLLQHGYCATESAIKTVFFIQCRCLAALLNLIPVCHLETHNTRSFYGKWLAFRHHSTLVWDVKKTGKHLFIAVIVWLRVYTQPHTLMASTEQRWISSPLKWRRRSASYLK